MYQVGGPVIGADDLREWRNRNVVDAAGKKIGTLESVYVDTATDQPAFASVTVGMPARRRLTFVPLANASVGPSYVKVAHSRSEVKGAPSIPTDGELAAADEEAVFSHYHLVYRLGATGERRLARR
jgi:hypothetical protein